MHFNEKKPLTFSLYPKNWVQIKITLKFRIFNWESFAQEGNPPREGEKNKIIRMQYRKQDVMRYVLEAVGREALLSAGRSLDIKDLGLWGAVQSRNFKGECVLYILQGFDRKREPQAP